MQIEFSNYLANKLFFNLYSIELIDKLRFCDIKYL